ncbi:hypothetical protein TSOC_003729 [Tetrabaena socialis]|uniref:Uncharacterized protein n=1 Tax=Tetrabaena socialis TaxID=47790 RepID=A0A2J8AAU0_9CHLO|nr:hypothetical protein TSOC_003729 [Tetrabaena socialis]|eukprot:PNH09646.1 hypothetical protein TSOC_003729 [Tetrabaena socialis]
MDAASEPAAVEVAEAGSANGASLTLLRLLVPLLWRRLNSAGRRHLRACCREARRIASCTVEALSLQKWGWEPAECADAAAGLRGMLELGCRPRSLTLTFRKGPEQWPQPEISALGLRVLAELRAVSPLPLVALSLTGLPLTEEVVRAITEAAPLLESLSLERYDLAHDTAQPDSTPGTPALSGVQGLLRLAAPHLQRLSLQDLAGPAGSPAPADSLGPLLLRCSRLEALSLQWYCAKFPVTLSGPLSGVLAQLPALRSLELALHEDVEAGAVGEPLVLPCLPQLTRLVARGGKGVLNFGNVLPAVAQMRGLADLQLPSHKLRPAHLLQLAALTALTRLHIGGVWTTDELVHDGGVEAGDSLRAAGAAPLVPLPAQLRVLVLSMLATASEVTALQLPPGLPLQLEGITIAAEDKDADGRLRPAAAESLLAACRQLVGRLCKCDKDLGPKLGPGAPLAFTVTLLSAAAPASWPDLYGTLFAALQPAMLRDLTVNQALLTVFDVNALVRHLPLLEDLALDCAVELPSLPLLARLKRLQCLHLYPEENDLEEGWDSELALRAALLVVCAESPSLTEVNLWFHPDPDPDDQLVAAAYAVADWLTGELPSLRGDPPELCVIIMD